MTLQDKQAIAQHVEYSLSELIDMLENTSYFGELKKTLELAQQQAEEHI